MCSVFTQTVQHLSFCLNTLLTHYLCGSFQLCFIDWSCQHWKKHTTFLAVTCYWPWLPALEKKHVAEVAVASYYFCSQLDVNLSLFFLSIFASFKMTVLLLISSTVWIWNNSRILPNFYWKLLCICAFQNH